MTTNATLEARAVGRELAQARQDKLDYLQDEYDLNEQEAKAEALELTRMETTAQLMERPRQELSWNDLDQLAEEDTALALQAWEEIKNGVREDHQNGRRAGRALEAHRSTPKEMAEFQVVRDELAAQHRPRNRIERTLVDMLAQTHASYLFW